MNDLVIYLFFLIIGVIAIFIGGVIGWFSYKKYILKKIRQQIEKEKYMNPYNRVDMLTYKRKKGDIRFNHK